MGKSYKSNGAQSHAYYTTQGPRRNGKYLPAKGPGNGQDGNGADEGRDDKKKFRNTKFDFEDKGEEESDTENSYELEITPKQLSQVTPGDIFSKDSTDIGKTPLITIDTGDSPPVCQKPYNLPLKHREWVQKELETLERLG